MATYKEIFGKQVKFLSSDPANEAEGQIWYNSTSGTFKSVLVSEAWSSSGSMISGRSTLAGASAGTQTATVFFGGYDGSVSNLTEEYDGVGWTVGGNLGTARYYIGGSGTLTAGLGFTGGAGTPGGSNATGATEEYDGSTWTAGGTMSTARIYIGTGAGTQTATFCFGGSTVPYPPSSPTNLVEEYNGASWTSSPAMPRASRLSMGFGTTTAAVNCGGNDYSTTTDEWNGTSWTEGGTLPVAKDAAASMGIQTAGMIAGGGNPGSAPGFTTVASKYDGTSWTALPAIATGRRHLPGAGTTTAAVIGGGETPPYTTVTEEFNVSANLITGASWASGGALNTGRMNVSMGGTQTDSILIGGHTSPGATPSGVELYDGSSWTTSGTVPYIADYSVYAGTSTLGVIMGGAPYATTSAELSGTSWTAGGSLNTGRSQLMGAGTQTAAVAFGGYTDATTETAVTEEYNGTAFTNNPNSMSLARGRGAGFGIQTAALCVAGNATPSETMSAATEEYNGTSWTAGGNYVVATGSFIGGFGTQTSGIAVGGADNGYTTLTGGYDGTAWSTRAAAANPAGRTQTAGADSSSGLRAGGGPNTTQRDGSEEYTGETTALNYKTITTS